MSDREMPVLITGGEVVARILEAYGVTCAFGVISIHNIPILDAFSKRARIRFVAARGEAGATNMADGYARVTRGLGVTVTSTGPGAGNACGAMTEALSAGTPLLHITGQIESAHVDRGRAMNHETRDQLRMLDAVSKVAFRVKGLQELAPVTTQALRAALTPPFGPVSLEIPIDLQAAPMPLPEHLPSRITAAVPLDEDALERLIGMMRKSHRPLLWLGGGAAHCGDEVCRLIDAGVAVVTTIHGRGVVPEDQPGTLGPLNNLPAAESFYQSCDLVVFAGTKLRGNETKSHQLRFPERRAQIDVDLAAWNRNYTTDLFVLGDAKVVLARLADAIAGTRRDPALPDDLSAAKSRAAAELREQLGPYELLCDALRSVVPRDGIFVRDVTISTNTWANRLFPIYDPSCSVSSMGGGIGQGLPQAIGACLGASGRRVVALVGDGGLAVNLGELLTAVDEGLDLLVILMNDGGYGVMRNIQDNSYQGRHFYSNLYLPDMKEFARAVGMRFWRAGVASDFEPLLAEAMAAQGPRMLEIDMKSVGPFAVPFAGPRMR